MAVRSISEEENLELIKRNLRNAAEILESWIAIFEDGLEVKNTEYALTELREALGNIESAYVDIVPHGMAISVTETLDGRPV